MNTLSIQYMGLKDLSGSLVVLEGIKDAAFDEIAEITLDSGEKRTGRIIEVSEEYTVVQVFEGTQGISLKNTLTKLTGKPLMLPMSKEILGRTFDGIGRPTDGFGPVYYDKMADINGKPMNPVAREYPRSFIQTGISAIDGLATLIKGQKLPIFSGNGMPHDNLAVQIATQAKIADDEGKNFAIVFGAMGVSHDVAFQGDV